MRGKEKGCANALDILSKTQRQVLSRDWVAFGEKFPEDDMKAHSQAQKIEKNAAHGLGRPADVIMCLEDTITKLETLLSTKPLTAATINRHINEENPLVGELFQQLSDSRNPRFVLLGGYQMEEKVAYLLSRFEKTAKDPLFNALRAEKLLQDWRESGAQLKEHEAKLRVELGLQAKLKMCTIGSSHKLPVATDSDGEDMEARLSGLSLDDKRDGQGTVVIVDEAGCIPAYELLGFLVSAVPSRALYLSVTSTSYLPTTPAQDGLPIGATADEAVKSKRITCIVCLMSASRLLTLPRCS